MFNKKLKIENERLRKMIDKLEIEKEELWTENFDLKFKNDCLNEELESIKPIVENPKLKPVVSYQCNTCKYCVKSRNRDVLGCNKDVVCEGFTTKGE